MARNKYPEVTVERIVDAAEKLFWEKGYEHTTIQDIIDELGDLSKGAIYHHFKSKEEIIDAVATRFYQDSTDQVVALKDVTGYTGLEKLKKSVRVCLEGMDQTQLLRAAPRMLENPKMLAMQIHSSVDEVAPQLIAPLIRQGVADGSIQTDYPEEMAQALLLLANLWLNPLVFTMTETELARRFAFLQQVSEKLGAPIFDQDLLPSIEAMRRLLAELKQQEDETA